MSPFSRVRVSRHFSEIKIEIKLKFQKTFKNETFLMLTKKIVKERIVDLVTSTDCKVYRLRFAGQNLTVEVT